MIAFFLLEDIIIFQTCTVSFLTHDPWKTKNMSTRPAVAQMHAHQTSSKATFKKGRENFVQN